MLKYSQVQVRNAQSFCRIPRLGTRTKILGVKVLKVNIVLRKNLSSDYGVSEDVI